MSVSAQLSAGPAITDADVAAASAALGRFLARRLGNSAHAEDVCQEAIARLLEKRDRLDSAAATPYAFTVAKSILVGEARRADVAQRHAHRIGTSAPPPLPEDVLLERAVSLAVSSALSSLADRDRHELLAHVIDEQPVAALAAESGGTVGGVAARLARTRARMRVEYLLAARGYTLPSADCHSVLVALSAGDRRRQHNLETAQHLLDCETCAAVAPLLVERHRHLAGLLPIPGLAALLGRIRHGLGSSPAATGTAVAGLALAGTLIVAVVTAHSGQSPRQHRAAVPASPTLVTGPVSVIAPLTANGASLPLDPATLSSHAGQPVTATSITVQAPLAPVDGIFVGDSPADSIFVDLADPLPNVPTQPLTPYQPGQKVSFSGRLVANTPDYVAEARDQDHIPGIEQILARGYHIEALPADVKPG